MGATQRFISPKNNDVTSDALIVELNSKPLSIAGITYAGWSRTETDVTSITTLHHPRRNPMKVSVAPALIVNGTEDVVDINGVLSYRLSNPWRMNWNAGMTAQTGSSGAGCFSQAKKVVGQISAAKQSSCNNRVAFAGRLSDYWAEGANVFLSDDPSVTQTNTTGIPSFNMPDVICNPIPLNIDWNGMTNMNFAAGGSLQGVQGAYVTATQLWIEPIPNFAGNGFINIPFKPNGITCNTPLFLRKDFLVGKPNPTVQFGNDWFPCENWLVASGTTGDSYQWTVHRYGYNQYFSGKNALIYNYGNPEYFWYELTVTNACGSKTVSGSGTLNGCNGPYLKGNDAGINALTVRNFKPVLSVSPNPATNEVTLNIKDVSPMMLNTLCDVMILNQMGQAVVNQKLILENAIRLDINSLVNGFYVVQVKGENGLSLSQKLMVNKK